MKTAKNIIELFKAIARQEGFKMVTQALYLILILAPILPALLKDAWVTNQIIKIVDKQVNGITEDGKSKGVDLTVEVSQDKNDGNIFGRLIGSQHFVQEYTAFAIYYAFLLVWGLGVFISNRFNKLSLENQKQVDLITSVYGAVSAKTKERVLIGIFDKLLLYSPVFVAKGLEFFTDELLDVTLVPIGSDRDIAEKVRAGELDFGVCDPIFCIDQDGGIPKSLPESREHSELMILMPIAKHLSIGVVGKVGFKQEVLSNVRNVVILSYRKPSTTYAIASVLKSWLIEGAGLKLDASNVSIEEIDSSDEIFYSQAKLLEKISRVDFALLYQPQLSWVKDGIIPSHSNFGILVRKTSAAGAQTNGWEIMSFDALNDQVPDAKGYSMAPYSPFDDRKTGHRAMISGMLVSYQTLTERPELCRRVFRSVTRSILLLKAIEWDLEEKLENKKDRIWDALERELPQAQSINHNALAFMISRQQHTPSRNSVFPFIRGITNYDPSAYYDHLMNMYVLWNKNRSFPGSPNLGNIEPEHVTKGHFTKYFVSSQLLSARGGER